MKITKNNCAYCEALQDFGVSEACPKHKPWYKRLYTWLRSKFDPSYKQENGQVL